MKANRKFGNNREFFPSPMCDNNTIFKCVYLATFREMHSMVNECSIYVCLVLIKNFYFHGH